MTSKSLREDEVLLIKIKFDWKTTQCYKVLAIKITYF